MGIGDQILGTGMAKGAAKRGKRIAFGDGQRIIWDHNSEAIFKGNPNIAKPGSEQDKDIEWIPFHRGNRIYNWHDEVNRRWRWNYSFHPIPGDIYFTDEELEFAQGMGSDFIIIEPNVPTWKQGASNKQWPYYADLVDKLQGYDVRQFATGSHQLAKQINAPTFRHALAAISKAKLYIGPEGGLHHGAAAVGVPAVVIFGSWIPPQVTGYDMHTNIGRGVACGSLYPCIHCEEAMKSISVNEVYQAAQALL